MAPQAASRPRPSWASSLGGANVDRPLHALAAARRMRAAPQRHHFGAAEVTEAPMPLRTPSFLTVARRYKSTRTYGG